MNKKILLSTILASSIVATSVFTGNVKAAIDVPNYGKQLIAATEKAETEDKYTLAILLPSSNNPMTETDNSLTKASLLDLLNKKFKNNIVEKVYEADEKTEINEYNANVGTGCIVKLTTGRKLTVVLYGDVNGDGKVNTNDSVAIAEYNVNLKELNDYQKKAAKLTNTNSEGVSTNDSVRLAYYNVNALNSEDSGTAILDMELYPEDYTVSDETVISDDVLQDAINTLATDANKELFDITLDPETNIADFGFVDSTKQISEFVKTGLIDTLVDQLKNNANLTKIELSVDEEKVELTSGDGESECLQAAYKLIAKALNKQIPAETQTLLDTTVDQLFGKELKAKFYVADTSKLVDEAVSAEDVMGGTYVEYTLKFVGKVNVDETIGDALNKVNGGEVAKTLFKLSFDPDTNTATFGFLNNKKQLSDFVKTGLINEVAEQLKNPNIKSIELSILKSNNDSVYATETLTHDAQDGQDITKTASAAVNLLKAALGDDYTSKTVLDLSGKTLKVKINLSENTDTFDTDVEIDAQGNKSISYDLNFLVDMKSEIENDIFSKLNNHDGNNIYRINFDETDDHLINFDLTEDEKTKPLSEICGQGNTGLIAMAKQIAGADGLSNIKDVTIKFGGQDYAVVSSNQISNKDIAGFLNAILELNLNDGEMITEPTIDAKVLQATLGVLEGKSVEVVFGLSEEAAQKSTWDQTETYTVQFNFVDALAE